MDAFGLPMLALIVAAATIDDPRTKYIEPLVQVHALDADSERAALQRLDAILAAGPALVIERDALLLPLMVQRLDACTLVLQAPTARLVRCADEDAKALRE